jgi:hypothetical protein
VNLGRHLHRRHVDHVRRAEQLLSPNDVGHTHNVSLGHVEQRFRWRHIPGIHLAHTATRKMTARSRALAPASSHTFAMMLSRLISRSRSRCRVISSALCTAAHDRSFISTHGHTDTQTHRHTDTQTQTHRHRHRHTDRQTDNTHTQQSACDPTHAPAVQGVAAPSVAPCPPAFSGRRSPSQQPSVRPGDESAAEQVLRSNV